MKTLIRNVSMIFLPLLLCYCSSISEWIKSKTQDGPVVSVPYHYRYDLPSISHVDINSQTKIKNKVTISVAVPKFSVERVISTNYKQIDESTILLNKYTFEKEVKPYYSMNPSQLSFSVKIYNNLDHVLRLAGTIISLQADGQLLQFEKSNYNNFLNGILLPKEEKQFDIPGPSTESLPSKCTLGLFIYDVISEMDKAGNPIEKSNFQWYFDFNKKNITEMDSIKTQIVKMTPEEARSIGVYCKERQWIEKENKLR